MVAEDRSETVVVDLDMKTFYASLGKYRDGMRSRSVAAKRTVGIFHRSSSS